MTKVRFAQYGTHHGHAAAKLEALKRNQHVELVGVYEPDVDRRRMLASAAGPFQGVYWFAMESEMLGDSSIAAVASEGPTFLSLDQTEACIRAGKHVWYDKPAGDNWRQWQRTVALAQTRELTIQMGYMWRYHAGFQQIQEWARGGLLGDILTVRARIGTSLGAEWVRLISRHRGGIFYELAGHVLDQVVWLMGRPQTVTSFLRNDVTDQFPTFADNTLGVFEYDNALAMVDISNMETPPPARRFEVYGSRGSAIMEPLDTATQIRLALADADAGYYRGEQFVPVESYPRELLYDLELAEFLRTIQGEQPPARPVSHDLLVQETLLRATGAIKG